MEPERNVTEDALGLSYRLYGVSPVQAEGALGDKPFYFRARHAGWSFSVAPTAEADPVEVESEQQGFYREGEYGRRFDASYMPFETAEALIRSNVHEYLRHIAASHPLPLTPDSRKPTRLPRMETREDGPLARHGAEADAVPEATRAPE